MENRHSEYDVLRAFAALMIVVNHIVQGFGISVNLGYYLSGTFVYVFLLLSAYLLGIRGKNIIIEGNSNSYLQKRVKRILPVYYPFLLISFLVIILAGWSLNWKQVIGHLTFLNWFWMDSRIDKSPLPQMGHLWFMTCIMLGYLSVYFVGFFKSFRKSLDNNNCLCVYFLLFAILFSFILSHTGKMEQLGVSTVIFVIIFYRGKDIFSFCDRLPSSIIYSLFFLVNIIAVFLYYNGLWDVKWLKIWINLLAAFSWMVIIPRFFRGKHIGKSVLYLSTISFEIYLVHHPFCLGAYSINNFFPDQYYISIPLVLLITFVLAVALNQIGRVANKWMERF